MNKSAAQTTQPAAKSLAPMQHLLQRKCACGNHKMAGAECVECGKKKHSLQRRLTVGASNDPLEQEADRIADQVLAAPSHPAGTGALGIQRYTGQTAGVSDIAPASVDRVLASSGSPLDPTLQQDMGLRFGHDFSQVRVHSGPVAEQSARELHAHAYTVGSNIVFGAGKFEPGTSEGRRLLAHELTHVVQQSGLKGECASQNDEKHASFPTAHPIVRRSIGAIVGGGLLGAGVGALVGGLIGGVPGAIVGGLLGAGVGALVGGLIARRRAKQAVAATLKMAAESLVEIGGTADAADKAVVVEELVKAPLIALTALKTKGVKVVVCRNSVTEIRTDLKGVQPRGWAAGKTWDTVPGLNDPNNNRVIIATRGGKVPPTGDGHGAVNLVLHEVGHAVGDAVVKGGVSDPAFIAARDADKALLDSYEGQAGAAGVRETYAESFARFYANDPDDAKTYPHLHAYWAANPFVGASE